MATSVSRGAALLRELAILLEGLSVEELSENKQDVAELLVDLEDELVHWRGLVERPSLEEDSMPLATERSALCEEEDVGIDSEDELPRPPRRHSPL